VLPAGDLKNEQYGGPMLLRIPAASLADLSAYGAKLRANGVAYNTIVTKVGFDPQAAYPKLTFSAVRALSGEELQIVAAQLSEDAVNRVLSQYSETEHGNLAPDATTLQEAPEPELELELEQEPEQEPAVRPSRPSPFATVALPAPTPAAKPVKGKTKPAKDKPALAAVPDVEPEAPEPRGGTDADIDSLINELNAL
jgi:hypothetical protein